MGVLDQDLNFTIASIQKPQKGHSTSKRNLPLDTVFRGLKGKTLFYAGLLPILAHMHRSAKNKDNISKILSILNSL